MLPTVPSPFLSRRRFLTASAALAALPLLPRQARAFSAQLHKLTLGDTALTVVSDGSLTLPIGVLAPSAPPEELQAVLAEMFGGTVPETVQPETNHVLIQAGADLILVDTGSGQGFQPTAGKLLEHLAANGIDPAAVTKVVITHAHPDHIWGTSKADGTLAFPNAAYYAGATEVAFWTDPATEAAMPDDFKPFAAGARRDLTAVADRLTTVKDGDSIAAGVSVIDTPGHTPGHISVVVEGGEGLIVTGDAVSNPVLSFAHPDWAFGFDAIPDMAIATRRALLDRAATEGHRLIGYHFPWPGAGRVERAGDAFRFVADAG